MSDVIIAAIVAGVASVASALISKKGEGRNADSSAADRRHLFGLSRKQWLVSLGAGVVFFAAAWIAQGLFLDRNRSLETPPSVTELAEADRAIAVLSTGDGGSSQWEAIFVDGQAMVLEEDDGGGLEILPRIDSGDPARVHLTFRLIDGTSGERTPLNTRLSMTAGDDSELRLPDDDEPLSIKIVSIVRATTEDA
ncbi:MAG: hypothetical protein AAF481_15930 [Acidobacteriota bacterium]